MLLQEQQQRSSLSRVKPYYANNDVSTKRVTFTRTRVERVVHPFAVVPLDYQEAL